MARRTSEAGTTLPELRQKLTDLVAQNAVAMVQCAIDGVMEEGQYQAIKYLFEMVGILSGNRRRRRCSGRHPVESSSSASRS